VSGLRLVAAAEGVIIPASRWGKAKTAGQMVAILVVILEPRWQLCGHTIGTYLLGVAVLLTLVSGIDYFVKARERLQPPKLGTRP
jgi:CDP-diacylglycerol--glycerol-3-phosphate 3-phosphatidyltransferase